MTAYIRDTQCHTVDTSSCIYPISIRMRYANTCLLYFSFSCFVCISSYTMSHERVSTVSTTLHCIYNITIKYSMWLCVRNIWLLISFYVLSVLCNCAIETLKNKQLAAMSSYKLSAKLIQFAYTQYTLVRFFFLV